MTSHPSAHVPSAENRSTRAMSLRAQDRALDAMLDPRTCLNQSRRSASFFSVIGTVPLHGLTPDRTTAIELRVTVIGKSKSAMKLDSPVGGQKRKPRSRLIWPMRVAISPSPCWVKVCAAL